MKLTYFIADVHLGLDYLNPIAREKKFASFLENLPSDTGRVYLLGDIFDFWYEYKDVIPRKFTRTLGALAHLCDKGVDVHFFCGNHDVWTYNYLQKEIGVIVHKAPAIVDIDGHNFFLGHGDALLDNNRSYRCLRWIFHNRFIQLCFSALHPRWAFLLGHSWSRHNRLTRYNTEDEASIKANREKLEKASVAWAADFIQKQAASEQPMVEHFILGHYHIPLSIKIEGGADLSILGDWLYNPDYIVFDGVSLERKSLLIEQGEV